MIFGLFDAISSRRRADKAYRVEDSVLSILRERGMEIPIENFDSESRGMITTPQTAVIYTLIGFNPEIDSEVADNLDVRVSQHDSQESVRQELEDQLRESMIRTFLLGPGETSSIVKSGRPFLKQLEPGSFEVIQKMDEYFIQDPELPYLRFNVSGRQLFDEDQKKFMQVLADIVQPLSFLHGQEQVDYLREVKDIKYKDDPSIICVAASADNLTKFLRYRE